MCAQVLYIIVVYCIIWYMKLQLFLVSHSTVLQLLLHLAGSEAASRVGPKIVLDHMHVYNILFHAWLRAQYSAILHSRPWNDVFFPYLIFVHTVLYSVLSLEAAHDAHALLYTACTCAVHLTQVAAGLVGYLTIVEWAYTTCEIYISSMIYII